MPTKVHLVKAMVFPVVMYGCESWTMKKAERQRIDAFELWCWRRLLRVPWTARRSNQSILKDISPECSLEGLMLKLQYFVHLMWITGKDPDAGKDRRQQEKGLTEDEMAGWHHWLDEHEFEQALGVGDGQWSLACCSPWGCKESNTTTTERMNWAECLLFNDVSKSENLTTLKKEMQNPKTYPFCFSMSENKQNPIPRIMINNLTFKICPFINPGNSDKHLKGMSFRRNFWCLTELHVST